MKTHALLWCLALLAAPSLCAGQPDAPVIPREPDPQRQADVRPPDEPLNELQRDQEARRRALEAEYSERRQELVESPEYRSLSRRERRGRIRALKNEFRVREQQVEDEYKSRREELEGAP